MPNNNRIMFGCDQTDWNFFWFVGGLSFLQCQDTNNKDKTTFDDR